MRFPSRLDFKLITFSAAALLIVSALALDSISDLLELKQLARAQMRDARHGTLNADFDVELVRAAGEAASFATTGNETYLREAREALERGEIALKSLEDMLADKTESREMQVEHEGFIKRQRQLFTQVKQGVRASEGLVQGTDPTQMHNVLNEIFAYESASAQLRSQIVSHRDKDFATNEQAMEIRAHHTIIDFLLSLALFVFFMGGLVYFARRAIVRPLDRMATAATAVAQGDFNQNVAATGHDEIMRLQVAFNEMVNNLRRQHSALAESESRFRQMAEHFPGVFIMGNAAGTDILYVSPGYKTVWGTSVESLYRQPASFVDSIHPDDRERALTEMKKLDRGEPCSQEYRILRPDGSVRWVWDRAFPIRDAQGQLYRITVVCEDITERRLMEEELRASEQQLQDALSEREAINRDLHDDVLQSIYAVGLTLEGVRRAIQTDSPVAKERVTIAIAQLNDIMRNVRLYILEPEARLRSTQDVMSALHSLIHTAQGNQAPSVSAEVDPGVMPSLPEAHARNLLQIVREAISNAQRHARAQSVKVALKQFNGSPRLTISDDGCGFETHAPQTPGHGLRNMAARAQLMGARLEILSQLGLGTQVAVEFPQPT